MLTPARDAVPRPSGKKRRPVAPKGRRSGIKSQPPRGARATPGRPASWHGRLRFLEPELHAHLVEHGRRRREVRTRPRDLAGLLVEPTEPQLAVRDEVAHSQLLRAGQRVVEVSIGPVPEIALSGDLAEKPERPSFVGALTAFPGEG